MQAWRLGIRVQADHLWKWKDVVRAALPFAIAGICVKVYSYMDTLLLRELWGEVSVGYYAIAYKVTYAFQFLPLAFVAALYPGMSAAAKEREALQTILEESLRLMMVVAAPLAALLSSFAPSIVLMAYGKEYSGSIAPMTILPWVLIPIFFDFPIGSLLNATHRASQKTIAMFVAMIINVAMNLLLIPRLGPAGAAWSAIVSFVGLACMGIWFIRHDVSSLRLVGSLIVRGLLVAMGVCVTMWAVHDRLALPQQVLFAVPLVFLLLVLTGLIRRDDLARFRPWITRQRGL